MGTFSMNMSSYEIERGENMASGYGDEVLCAGWIPVLGLREAHSEHVEIPPALARMDVDAFLRKMYACQR
jgi:hypothetical protein